MRSTAPECRHILMCVFTVILSLSYGFKTDSEFHSQSQLDHELLGFYRPCSEASEGYAFKGMCLFIRGGGRVDITPTG